MISRLSHGSFLGRGGGVHACGNEQVPCEACAADEPCAKLAGAGGAGDRGLDGGRLSFELARAGAGGKL